MTPHPTDFEIALGEHEPLLRRVARRLVANAMDADEVVQEALMAAWAARDRPAAGGGRVSGDESGGSLGNLASERVKAWLLTVVRRKAASKHRGPRPIDPGKDVSDEGDEQLAPLAIGLRLERQRLITEALMRLPGPTRDAIVMRYQDGLTTARIAAMGEESPNTVQSRIRRGLAALRADLEQHADPTDQEDGRAPWLAAVLPMAFPTGAPPEVMAWTMPTAAGASATAAAPVGTVSLATLLFSPFLAMGLTKSILLAFVAVVGIGAFRSRTDLPPVDQQPAIAREEAVIAGLHAPGDSSLAKVAPTVQRQAVAPGNVKLPAAAPGLDVDGLVTDSLSGRVLFLDGSPIPGATVIALVGDGTEDAARAQADSDGRFVLKLAPMAEGDSATLKVDMGRFDAPGATLTQVPMNAQDLEFRVDALMVRLRTPDAKVLDGDGDPTALLMIQAVDEGEILGQREPFRFTPAHEGRVTRLLPSGPAYTLRASLGPFADDDHVGFLPAGLPAGQYDLDLTPDAPELGSITISAQHLALPADSDVAFRVRLKREGRRAGSFKVTPANPVLRMSCAYPGDYEVTISVDGTAPYGFILPDESPISVRVEAGQDSPVEVAATRGGMVGLTVLPPSTVGGGGSGYVDGASLDGLMILHRQPGDTNWDISTIARIGADGAVEPIGFPYGGEPTLIDTVLPVGTFEFILMGLEGESAPIAVDVLEGRFSALSIPYPTGG